MRCSPVPFWQRWPFWALPSLLQRVELPVTIDLTLDYRVLAFAIGLSLITGVAFGLAPALKATSVDLVTTLRDEGVPPLDHRRLTLKNALIVVQVAVSVLLLGGTSIFLQQAAASAARRVGYAVDGVAMIETDAGLAGYQAGAAANVYNEILRRIPAIPGVQAAALSPASVCMPSSPLPSRDDRARSVSVWRWARAVNRSSGASREAWPD